MDDWNLALLACVFQTSMNVLLAYTTVIETPTATTQMVHTLALAKMAFQEMATLAIVQVYLLLFALKASLPVSLLTIKLDIGHSMACRVSSSNAL